MTMTMSMFGPGRRSRTCMVWIVACVGIVLVAWRQLTLLNQSQSYVLGQDEDDTAECRNDVTSFRSSDLCRRLFRDEDSSSSAASIWMKHQEKILQASLLSPKDAKAANQHETWMRALLELVSPTLLGQGLRQAPNPRDLKPILQRLYNKLLNHSAPPLQVTILGGSVTEGSGCETIQLDAKHDVQYDADIRGRTCAWPFRLQRLVNSIFGKDVVKIYNLATGGTNSKQALPVIRYRLYQNEELRRIGPDIIINAYSTNDNHYSWKDTNATRDFEHFDKCLDMAHDFIQTARTSRPCHSAAAGLDSAGPLVVFVDEYLGNSHELLLGQDVRHDAVSWLVGMSSVAYISSARAIRQYVLAQSNETIFSPHWYDNKQQRVQQVHFGMPGHTWVAWVVAYSVLQVMVDVCQDDDEEEDVSLPHWIAPASQHLLQSSLGIPDVTAHNLSISSVATAWQQTETAARAQYCDEEDSTTQHPCPFAFLATPVGTTRNARRLNQYMARFVTHNTGWKGENDVRNGWQNKVGLVAHQQGASVTLRLPNIDTPVRHVHVHSLVSYGSAWKGSEAEFVMSVWYKNVLEFKTSWRRVGFHADNTSIAVPHHIELGKTSAEVGRSVELKITLINGTNFKIIALMLCNR